MFWLILLLGFGCNSFKSHLQTKQYKRFNKPKSVNTIDPITNSYSSYSTANTTIEKILPSNPAKLSLNRQDNFIEKGLIFGLSFLLKLNNNNNKDLSNVKIDSKVYYGMSFEEMAILTKDLLLKNDKNVLKRNIISLLTSVVPIFIRMLFQFSYQINPQWLCEISTKTMTLGLLEWLVGPVERYNIVMTNQTKQHLSESLFDGAYIQTLSEEEIENQIIGNWTNGVSLSESHIIGNWTSGVKLLECRYLAQSKCKSNCLYICKTPTQEFFKTEMGFPLYMKPNFTDYSCELQFGVLPPLIEDDPAFKELCFSDCTSKRTLC